jgi:hypothetical protein
MVALRPAAAVLLRLTARYTVERATPNRSPSSAVVYSPLCISSTRCASWRGFSLGSRSWGQQSKTDQQLSFCD